MEEQDAWIERLLAPVLQRDRVRAIRRNLERRLLAAMQAGDDHLTEVIEVALWPEGGPGIE